jgi:hypothetical protein
VFGELDAENNNFDEHLDNAYYDSQPKHDLLLMLGCKLTNKREITFYYSGHVH